MNLQNSMVQMIQELEISENQYHFTQRSEEQLFVENINNDVEEDIELKQENKAYDNVFDFLTDSSDWKHQTRLTEVYYDEQEESSQFKDTIRSVQINEASNSTNQTQILQVNNKIKSSLKNFLVLFSSWLRNYFIQLYKNKTISFELFDRFEKIVLQPNQRFQSSKSRIRRSFGVGYQKVYINLKKLSQLFNSNPLKPYIQNFFDHSFLRCLVLSKTKYKSCILNLLPVLKKGLAEGRISNLR